MTFLVGIETPTRGSLTLGFLNSTDKKSAQRSVVESLVSAGFPRDRIGIQVTDNISLEIGPHKVSIIPIKEFDATIASALAALL